MQEDILLQFLYTGPVLAGNKQISLMHISNLNERRSGRNKQISNKRNHQIERAIKGDEE